MLISSDNLSFNYGGDLAASYRFDRVPSSAGEAEAQMMTCKLYNASYAAHFEAKSTDAQFITAAPAFKNWMPAVSTMGGTPADLLVSRWMNMQAGREVFAMMVTGPIKYSNKVNFPTTNSVYSLGMNQARRNETLFQKTRFKYAV
ncbi:hypothetical protein CLCR_07729 [Cladophialophora carrionii]|uniref:Uncharacterized protein n=1 Tax=Cladophialophora carrionii TaxID=86049 RepID=A0A1C1CNP2_9EURO|nr:hypothetical protein CLCR_07729 [Cladophialophora carrionii]